MKNLRKLLNINLNKSETEKFMSQMLTQKFDGELKNRYSQILAEKYDVQRTESKNIRRIPIFGIAATFLVLIMAVGVYFYTTPSETDYKFLAIEYDSKNQYASNILTRGDSDINKDLQNAYEQFESAAFIESKEILLSIELSKKSDIFLLAYTQFKTGDYLDANTNFQLVLSMQEDDTYHPEARLYNILSCYASGQIEKGNRLQQSLNKNTWEYKELQKAFN